MKLVVDMNLSPDWKDFLAKAGIDAMHWSGLGAASAQDAEIVEFAGNNGCIVLTRDLDFGAILASTGRTKPSWSKSGRKTPDRARSAGRSMPPCGNFPPNLTPAPWSPSRKSAPAGACCRSECGPKRWLDSFRTRRANDAHFAVWRRSGGAKGAEIAESTGQRRPPERRFRGLGRRVAPSRAISRPNATDLDCG